MKKPTPPRAEPLDETTSSPQVDAWGVRLQNIPLWDANPFATSRVQPGAIPFLFEPEESLESLLNRLARNGRRGQIIGPHGVGKSTLLMALARQLAATGDQVVLQRIGPTRSASRQDTWGIAATPDKYRRKWLLIDGWEQVAGWRRKWLTWRMSGQHCGLVVTCHTDSGLPELARLTVDPHRLALVVSQLTAGFPPLIGESDVLELWRRHPTNAREILFGLYDLYEVRRRAISTGVRS